MLLYYITDRTQFPGDEITRRQLLLNKIGEAASAGVDYIQLREKDLSARELESLAREALARIQSANSATKLLINSRIDIAIAVGAHGVHLRSDDISPENIREIYKRPKIYGADAPVREPSLVIGVSCHTVEEASRAAAAGATFVVFGPVFEKAATPSAALTGFEALREACQHKIPVFALGGLTLSNAHACLQVGAAGIAAVRLFQENNVLDTLAQLK